MSRLTDHLRAAMVAGLLVPDCRVCEASSGAWCDPFYPESEWPSEMVRVDRSPARVVHSSRVVAAVAGRHVSRRVLVNQFAGGQLPAGLAA